MRNHLLIHLFIFISISLNCVYGQQKGNGKLEKNEKEILEKLNPEGTQERLINSEEGFKDDLDSQSPAQTEYIEADFVQSDADGQELQQQSKDNSSNNEKTSTEKIFDIVIIIGGYVAIIIAGIIYVFEAREDKIVQFEEITTRQKITTTESQFNKEGQGPAANDSINVKRASEENGKGQSFDSARKKKRKRKADRLSDRIGQSSQGFDDQKEEEEVEQKSY